MYLIFFVTKIKLIRLRAYKRLVEWNLIIKLINFITDQRLVREFLFVLSSNFVLVIFAMCIRFEPTINHSFFYSFSIYLKKMDFFNSFIPVFIKYDFVSENQVRQVTNVSKPRNFVFRIWASESSFSEYEKMRTLKFVM